MSVAFQKNGQKIIEFDFNLQEIIAYNSANNQSKNLSTATATNTIASYCNTVNCYNCNQVHCNQVQCSQVKCNNVQCNQVQCNQVKCSNCTTVQCVNCSYDSRCNCDCNEKDG